MIFLERYRLVPRKLVAEKRGSPGWGCPSGVTGMTDVTFPLPPGLSRQQRSSWDKREYTPSALLAMGGAHRHTCSCKHIAPTPEQTREDAHSPAHRQGPTRVSVSLGPAQPRVTLLADTPLGICSLHGPPQRPAPAQGWSKPAVII